MTPAAKRPRLSLSTLDPTPIGKEAFQFHPITGRPIRARRPVIRANYVDPVSMIPPEEGESSNDEGDGETIKPFSRKRRCYKSPSPPPMSPSPQDDVLSANSGSVPNSASSVPRQVSLTFNVSPGHQGPFVVHLDLCSLLGPASPVSNYSRLLSSLNTTTVVPSSSNESSPSFYTTHAFELHAGYLDLPAELRNDIYRILFTAGGEVQLGGEIYRPNTTVFCRSSQFLRTCKLVHREGADILYGENRFMFRRQTRVRGHYYDPVWKEVGFKDMRVFLKNIGQNLGLIRDVKIILEDAAPSRTPDDNNEARRFVHDEVLLECLAVMGKKTFLQRLTLDLSPRRGLDPDMDYRFLQILYTIKADEICMCWDRYFLINRSFKVKDTLMKKMQRQKKLYEGSLPVSPSASGF